MCMNFKHRLLRHFVRLSFLPLNIQKYIEYSMKVQCEGISGDQKRTYVINSVGQVKVE